MVDPRLYRTGLVVVALAVIVFAFSLQDQPGPLGSTLAPSAFNGQNAFTSMTTLAGEPAAQQADQVAGALKGYGYTVARTQADLQTAQGSRPVQTVTGTLAGNTPAAIVIVADVPPSRGPSATALSGVGTLIELARVLHGESPNHTLIFAYTSDPAGLAPLAASLPSPVDAVLVLGDLAAAETHPPFVVPWSHGIVLAPPALRQSLTAALGQQAGLPATGAGLAGQILHLAFPMTLSAQAPFVDGGLPAALLSLTGERPSPAGLLTDPAQAMAAQGRVSAVGRAVLEAVNGLDGGSQLPAPTSYLIYDGKLIPLWSVRLLVLALLLPVALTTIDALARVRRRGHALGPWIAWALLGSFGFLLAALVVELGRISGLLSGSPGAPVAEGVPGPHGGAVAVIAVAAVALAAGLLLVRPWLAGLAGARRLWRRPGSEEPGAPVAALLVLIVTALVMWWRNPFAALMLVPAVHLWMWLSATDLDPPRAAKLAIVALGATLPAGAIVYYALISGLTPLGVLWNGVLMIARGEIGVVSLVLWSIVFGCLASVFLVALMPRRQRVDEEVPITVRGPATYAGPGSLGGTESALRR